MVQFGVTFKIYKMKKVLLVLAIFATFLTVNAQTPTGEVVPTVSYKINSVGASQGLNIPNPHYFHVLGLSAEIDKGVGMMLICHNATTIDSVYSGSVQKFKNDSISPSQIFTMDFELLHTLPLPQMIEHYVEARLKEIYGASNVTKIE